MIFDPGTIYSDDEIECFSEDDDEEEKEAPKGPLSLAKLDPFFENLEDVEFSGIGDLRSSIPIAHSIKKYLNKKNSHNIDATIDRVRLKIKDDMEVNSDVEPEDEENVVNFDAPDIEDKLKVKKKDIKIKELKRIRKEETAKQRLEKDIEESKMIFEHAPPPPPESTFLEMNLFPPILKAIAYMGYKDPTPIQASTIPIALKGRDICACAATGTGKTAAFMLPILQRLLIKGSNEASTRVLVLVPTRELGVQVYEVTEQLAKFTKIRTALAVGGLNHSAQSKELLENPDIIIATPGRLIDHIHNTPAFSLREIEVLVLDEADRMLDEFFVEQLNEIVRQCCVKRQTMLFSATMTDSVKDLAAVSLKNPVRVFVNNNTDVAQNLRQEFIKLPIQTEDCRLGILAYLVLHQFTEECMVFVSKKSDCHILHITFGLLGVKCGELHSNLKQHQRLSYLQKFRDKKINVLFATDVAARGLDIKGVKTIINFTVPNTYELYVHRVGRTARAGFSGRSITLAFSKGPDRVMLRKIHRNSLYPLYERVVKKRMSELYTNKIKALRESVQRVIDLEKEEKEMHGVMMQIEESKEKLLNEKKMKMAKLAKEGKMKPSKLKRKQLRQSLFKTSQQIKEEKERLQRILDGKSDPLEKEEKKKKRKESKKQRLSFENKKKATFKNKDSFLPKAGNEVNPVSAVKRKSNFSRDLTDVSQKSVKKLKKGPSFGEKQEISKIPKQKRKTRK